MATVVFDSEKQLELLVRELLADYSARNIQNLKGIVLDNFHNPDYHATYISVCSQFPVGIYGIIDLFACCDSEAPCENDLESHSSVAHIFELKNVPIQSADFEQTLRYKTAIDSLGLYKKVVCHLIGPSVKSGLNLSLCLPEFYTYEYDWSYYGIFFKRFLHVPAGNDNYTPEQHSSRISKTRYNYPF